MLSSDAGISSMPSSMISNISESDHNSSTTMIATNNSSHHQEYGNMGCQVSKGGIQNQKYFFAKNPNRRREYMYFENRTSKIGHHFRTYS